LRACGSLLGKEIAELLPLHLLHLLVVLAMGLIFHWKTAMQTLAWRIMSPLSYLAVVIASLHTLNDVNLAMTTTK
jgi:hypothetical protein